MPIILPGNVAAGGLALQSLVRELAERMGEFVLATPTALGTATSLIDTGLNQYYPADVTQSNIWVYGTPSVPASNIGVERRARSWSASASALALHAPGFPDVITATGQYEIHTRTSRSRKVRAINEAVGQLALSWYREFIDESLITVESQWRYTLPNAVNWSAITKIEIQASTNSALLGYPYMGGQQYDCRAYSTTDTSGNTTWYLQFGSMPPPGRTIRVFGEGYTSDLTLDTDTLALDGKWKQSALAWIFDYGEYRLAQWESNRQPAGQADRYRIMSLDRLNAAKDRLMKQAPAHKPRPIITPGHGDAQAYPAYQGAEWLGAFSSIH